MVSQSPIYAIDIRYSNVSLSCLQWYQSKVSAIFYAWKSAIQSKILRQSTKKVVTTTLKRAASDFNFEFDKTVSLPEENPSPPSAFRSGSVSWISSEDEDVPPLEKDALDLFIEGSAGKLSV
jgi:hypothetical protein